MVIILPRLTMYPLGLMVRILWIFSISVSRPLLHDFFRGMKETLFSGAGINSFYGFVIGSFINLYEVFRFC